ncbi:MAG: hypothetical protein D6728_06945 [Cyanobacteria bacterium J055]|nr:MAG: hypothetical protein D6728_06945 [Cyanobacteria bacterium J055]
MSGIEFPNPQQCPIHLGFVLKLPQGVEHDVVRHANASVDIFFTSGFAFLSRFLGEGMGQPQGDSLRFAPPLQKFHNSNKNTIAFLN